MHWIKSATMSLLSLGAIAAATMQVLAQSAGHGHTSDAELATAGKRILDAYYGNRYTLQNMDALILAAPECEINPVSMPDFGRGIAVRYQVGNNIIATRKAATLGAAMSEAKALCDEINNQNTSNRE